MHNMENISVEVTSRFKYKRASTRTDMSISKSRELDYYFVHCGDFRKIMDFACIMEILVRKLHF